MQLQSVAIRRRRHPDVARERRREVALRRKTDSMGDLSDRKRAGSQQRAGLFDPGAGAGADDAAIDGLPGVATSGLQSRRVIPLTWHLEPP